MYAKRNNQTKIYLPNITDKQLSDLEDYLNAHLDTSQRLGLYNRIKTSKNKNKKNKNSWEIRFYPNKDFDKNLFCGYISGFFNTLYNHNNS
jgi:hypothetical protein